MYDGKQVLRFVNKEALANPEEESYDYEDYEIVKHRNKDDLVL